MADWQYDKKRKTYIDADGRVMSQVTLHDVRDAYLSATEDLIDSYVNNLFSGTWTVAKFEEEMRKRLKHAYIAEYTLGAGGSEQMTQSDYGRVGAQLKKQYKYLRTYLQDLADGKETTGNARQRANNFLGSARQAFSRGMGKSWGISLPGHPGEGTECGGNCQCSWNIEEDEKEVRAYWQLGAAEHCDGCKNRAAMWNPYVESKEDNA